MEHVIIAGVTVAIECSICRAEREDGLYWSDQAECMFWPPMPIDCGSDRYNDCVTKLEFTTSGEDIPTSYFKSVFFKTLLLLNLLQ